MKLLKALILICLLGRDHGPDPASLEAFSSSWMHVMGERTFYVHQLPNAFPILLYHGHFSVESTLLAGVLLMLIGQLRHSTGLGKPILGQLF